MESSVDQRLSLLLDGEASEFETRRLVEDISKNPHIKKRWLCLLYTSPSPRDISGSRMPSSA